MDGSKLIEKDRSKFLRLWATLSYEELEGLFESFNADSNLHNEYRNRFGRLRTPTKEEYKSCAPLRKFLKHLKPKAVVLTKLPDSQDTMHALLYPPRMCTINVTTYMTRMPEEPVEVVFGFRLWLKEKPLFMKAEGHCWLRNKETGKFIDPTPSEDSDDEQVMLVETEAYLTKEDRVRVLQDTSLRLPSMQNINTRERCGCRNVDPIFFSEQCAEYHAVQDLHPLGPVPGSLGGELLPVDETTSSRNRKREQKQDPEFWAWRQSIVDRFY